MSQFKLITKKKSRHDSKTGLKKRHNKPFIGKREKNADGQQGGAPFPRRTDIQTFKSYNKAQNNAN